MRMATDLLAGELHTRKTQNEYIPPLSEPTAMNLQSIYNDPGILESFISMVSVDEEIPVVKDYLTTAPRAKNNTSM